MLAMTSARAALLRRARFFQPVTVLFVLVSLVLAVSVVFPFILLLINSFTVTTPPSAAEYGLDGWRFALSDRGMLDALKNTAYVALVRHSIAFPLALVIAWLIARTDMPWGKALEFFFWVAFFLPVVPVVQAWILLAHPDAGLLNQTVALLPFVEKGGFNIYSFWGIIWVHLFSNTIAILVMLLVPVMRHMDASLEDASRISGASPLHTLFRITAPVMTPALATLFVLALMRAFQTIEIELLLGLPIGFFVFGSKIFDLTRLEPPLYGAATAMGIVILVAMVPLILAHRAATGRRHFTTLTGKYNASVLQLRKWRWPAFSLVMAFALMMTAVPFIFLMVGTFMKFSGFFFDVPGGPWTLNHWTAIVDDRLLIRGIKNTIYLGLGSATITIFITSMVAYIIVRTRFRFRAGLDFISWIPFVFPGVILALAWLWILLQMPFLRPIYGTIWALILVSGLSSFTLGVQLVKANLLQLGGELEEASAITGAGFFVTFTKVVIPLLAPTLVVVWILNFVSAAGSAIIPALLATPASRPLALLQLEQLLSGEPERASIVGVFVIALTIGVAIVARIFGFRIGLGRES